MTKGIIMLSIDDAQDLMLKFINLKNKFELSKNNEDLKELKVHEKICIEKFSYLVQMRIGRYKAFSNYEDLNQEGLEALTKAMKTYNPEKKGIFFWWANKYIGTKIARSANFHSTIHYPLKFSKINIPHREIRMPILIEKNKSPEKLLEMEQSLDALRNTFEILEENQKNILNFVFGFENDKPLSISKICKKMSISRAYCIRTLNSALICLRGNIRL
jgi:RNA polymerase sigma factor (sigma-70 family)